MSKRFLGLVGMMLVLSAWALPVSAQPHRDNVFVGNLEENAPAFVPGRVVVSFEDAVSEQDIVDIAGQMGASVQARPLDRGFQVLSVPRQRIWQTIRNLQRDPRVRYAHPDWIAYAHQIPPNDPLYPLQWHLDADEAGAGSIHVEGAWSVNPGGDAAVVVAVIDTGVAYENYGRFCRAPDLAETIFVAGYDFVNNDSHPNDDNGHGTHVAGTIAQSTNNDEGVAGIAYRTAIMPLKVLGPAGSGSISSIANAIRWAADHGAHVINMSLGTPAPPLFLGALRDAVRYAYDSGVVIVASSGNASAANPYYPAAYPEVIAVGATKYDKTLASYSNRGNEVCAPGGTSNTNEDLNGDNEPDMVLQNTFNPDTKAVCEFDYWFFAGTSMAAPHVSGVAALILAEDPTLSHTAVRQVLRDTADNGVTADCGYGLIDAAAALEAVATGDNPPQVSIVTPPDGAVVADMVTIQIAATDEDATGTLTVRWSLDGATWFGTDFNSGTGYYEADWDTTAYSDDAYTIRAQATDSATQTTDASPVSVTVNNENEVPVAAFTATCDGNVCSFDASGTSDDGSIVEYTWDFGDGQSGQGVTVDHTYTAIGTYTVTLTVEDDAGATDSETQQVTIDELTNTVHVGDLDARGRRIFFGIWEARVTIRVHDTGGAPVPNATVYGLFSDGPSVFQCTTGSTGSCNVYGYQWAQPCLTFSVTDIYHATLDYRPEDNQDPDGDSDGTHITVCRP